MQLTPTLKVLKKTKFKCIFKFFHLPNSRPRNTSAEEELDSVMLVLQTDAPARPVGTRSALLQV